ncbi:MAG: hypothetical protein EOQ70_32540, partial [Mesorhizobium sp.]
MPAKRRLTMRQLRQMLRLAGSGTSSREIAVAAGDKVFVDYSGKKIPIVDRDTGELREAEIFVAVLG